AVIACATFVVVFAIEIIPISNRWPILQTWLVRLVTHKGQYGGGDAGLIDWQTVPRTLKTLVAAELPLFVATFAGLLLIAVTWRATSEQSRADEQRRAHRALIVGILIALGTLVITTRQASQHYLLP